MTPGIGSSGAHGAARQAALSSRPHVQTRRVSVTLGPLGISYSTDQIVWGRDDAAQAGPAPAPDAPAGPLLATGPLLAAEDAAAPPVDAVAGVAAWKPGADAASDSDHTRSGGGFDSALDQAWSALAAGLAASSTYDRTGAVRGSRQAAATADTATAECAGQEDHTSRAEAAASVAAGTAAPTPSGGNAENAGRGVAAWRLRQAVAAYLACGEGFAATRPMLRVTA